VSEDRAKAVVDDLASDAALMNELRYWLSTMRVASIIAKDRISAAEDLRSVIGQALGSPPETDAPSGADGEAAETPK